MREYLGMYNFFWAHVRNYAQTAVPLSALTCKDQPWKEEALPDTPSTNSKAAYVLPQWLDTLIRTVPSASSPKFVIDGLSPLKMKQRHQTQEDFS